MIEKSYKIINLTGLDAKNSSVLVSKCSKYSCNISLSCSEITVNLKSIMGVMSLNVHKGELVTLIFDGVDEVEADSAISYLMSEMKLAKEF